MDFILERYDGFHDLLELKSPQDAIVLAPDAVDDVPPPAHDFALSRDLAQALAQVHAYRDVLSADEAMVSKLYGLRNTRNARVFIVIGQSAALPTHRARVLRDLNLTLHGWRLFPMTSSANVRRPNVRLGRSRRREDRPRPARTVQSSTSLVR